MKKKNNSWIVKVRRMVISELVVNGCDEETARTNPYDHCDQETDMDQEDYEVLSVEESK